MKSKILALLLVLSSSVLFAQNNGATPCTAIDLYQSAIGDCNNSCGAQLCGEYQCENTACNQIAMPGTATIDGSCTADNDIGQAAVWLSVTATAADIVIENETNYTGGTGPTDESRDYTIFSGACGSLTEAGCSANVTGGASATFTGLTVGTTYFIQVTQSAAAIGTCPGCTSSASCAQSSVPFVPSNATCGGATAMTSGVTVNSTNTNGGTTGNLSVCDGPASGSVENTTWFQWCAPVTWTAGDPAYVNVFNQTCNATQGLQMSVYGAVETCATIAAWTSTSLVCENPGTTSDYFYQWNANPGECFIIILDGFAGTACNFNIRVNDSPLLNVELTDLTAEMVNNDFVELNWKTESETNNSHFVVERSKDGKEFEPLKRVIGSGTSNYSIAYKSLDQNPLPGTSYYRLLQVDSDGTESTSKVIAVTTTTEFEDLIVYPNPVNGNGELKFSSNNSGLYYVSIVDLTGRKMWSKQISVFAGPNDVKIKTDNLSAGLFFVTIDNGLKSEQIKFIKE